MQASACKLDQIYIICYQWGSRTNGYMRWFSTCANLLLVASTLASSQPWNNESGSYIHVFTSPLPHFEVSQFPLEML